jgi:beta-glucanase (GH16 family)
VLYTLPVNLQSLTYTIAGCPADLGLNSATYSVDFTKGVPSEWKMTTGNVTTGANGAQFSIKTVASGPTMQSNFYIFFGYVEAVIQAAPGQGIVSSFILESDDLDEVDWEIIGSQTTQVQSNYFGKGNTTTYDRGQFHPVTTPASSFHTYAVDWRQDQTIWYIDGVAVRTLNFADAVGGKNYPQTPMNIRLGNWVAGQASNSPGTVQWAGGLADMSQAPFNMFCKSITVKNYNPAGSYNYGDLSGSYQSIQMGGALSSSSQPVHSSSSSVSNNNNNSGNNKASSPASSPSLGATIAPTGSSIGIPASSTPAGVPSVVPNTTPKAAITTNVAGGNGEQSPDSSQGTDIPESPDSSSPSTSDSDYITIAPMVTFPPMATQLPPHLMPNFTDASSNNLTGTNMTAKPALATMNDASRHIQQSWIASLLVIGSAILAL